MFIASFMCGPIALARTAFDMYCYRLMGALGSNTCHRFDITYGAENTIQLPSLTTLTSQLYPVASHTTKSADGLARQTHIHCALLRLLTHFDGH